MIVNRFDDTLSSIGISLLDHGNNNTVEADVTVRALLDVENPVIFDVGANIGTYASWVARWAAARNGRVYCFEPQRVVFQMLCGNMAINNIFNVHAYQLGLGKEESYIDLPEINYQLPGSSFAAFSLDGVDRKKYQNVPNSSQRVEISTLDKFVHDWNINKIDFIKIDAEGLDIDVIEGGMNSILKFKPDLLVEYLHLGSSKDEDTREQGKLRLVDYLDNFGYSSRVVGHDIYASTRNLKDYHEPPSA